MFYLMSEGITHREPNKRPKQLGKDREETFQHFDIEVSRMQVWHLGLIWEGEK